jgi:hypothetical protein
MLSGFGSEHLFTQNRFPFLRSMLQGHGFKELERLPISSEHPPL